MDSRGVHFFCPTHFVPLCVDETLEISFRQFHFGTVIFHGALLDLLVFSAFASPIHASSNELNTFCLKVHIYRKCHYMLDATRCCVRAIV